MASKNVVLQNEKDEDLFPRTKTSLLINDDETPARIDEKFSKKQNKLIAGNNITINEDGVTINAVIDSSNIPQATEKELGGIKAKNKTIEDTQEVHIDSTTGMLYTKPSISEIVYDEVGNNEKVKNVNLKNIVGDLLYPTTKATNLLGEDGLAYNLDSKLDNKLDIDKKADSTSIGGIIANEKTTSETEEVKIDSNTGILYSKKVPTKVSELENDSKFLTKVPAEYVTEQELLDKEYDTVTSVNDKLSTKLNLDDTAVDSSKLGGVEASKYALKIEIPTKTSELTNDSNFLTSHQDISGKQDKEDSTLQTTANTIVGAINEINTALSGFQPSGDYALKSDIPTNNNQLENGAGYITSADGGNAATLDGSTKEEIIKSSSNNKLNIPSDIDRDDNKYSLICSDNINLYNTFKTGSSIGTTGEITFTKPANINEFPYLEFNESNIYMSNSGIIISEGGISLVNNSEGITSDGNISAPEFIENEVSLANKYASIDSLNTKQDNLTQTQLDNIDAVPEKLDANGISVEVYKKPDGTSSTTIVQGGQIDLIGVEEGIIVVGDKTGDWDTLYTGLRERPYYFNAGSTNPNEKSKELALLSDLDTYAKIDGSNIVDQYKEEFIKNLGLATTTDLTTKQDNLTKEQLNNIAAVPNKIDATKGAELFAKIDGSNVINQYKEDYFKNLDLISATDVSSTYSTKEEVKLKQDKLSEVQINNINDIPNRLEKPIDIKESDVEYSLLCHDNHDDTNTYKTSGSISAAGQITFTKPVKVQGQYSQPTLNLNECGLFINNGVLAMSEGEISLSGEGSSINCSGPITATSFVEGNSNISDIYATKEENKLKQDKLSQEQINSINDVPNKMTSNGLSVVASDITRTVYSGDNDIISTDARNVHVGNTTGDLQTIYYGQNKRPSYVNASLDSEPVEVALLDDLTSKQDKLSQTRLDNIDNVPNKLDLPTKTTEGNSYPLLCADNEGTSKTFKTGSKRLLSGEIQFFKPTTNSKQQPSLNFNESSISMFEGGINFTSGGGVYCVDDEASIGDSKNQFYDIHAGTFYEGQVKLSDKYALKGNAGDKLYVHSFDAYDSTHMFPIMCLVYTTKSNKFNSLIEALKYQSTNSMTRVFLNTISGSVYIYSPGYENNLWLVYPESFEYGGNASCSNLKNFISTGATIENYTILEV